MDLPLVVPNVPLQEVEPLSDGHPAGYRMPEARLTEVVGLECSSVLGDPVARHGPAQPQGLKRLGLAWSEGLGWNPEAEPQSEEPFDSSESKQGAHFHLRFWGWALLEDSEGSLLRQYEMVDHLEHRPFPFGLLNGALALVGRLDQVKHPSAALFEPPAETFYFVQHSPPSIFSPDRAG